MSRNKLKVLIVQVPFPFRFPTCRQEVPSAAGYLKAMAVREGLTEEADIDLLCAELYGLTDTRLVDEIVSRAPDVLGFTLYIWNSLRSLHIAGEVKKRLPSALIMAGGPDVTRDSEHIIGNPAIDLGCLGEGEFTFVEALREVLAGGRDWSGIKGILYREGGAARYTAPRERATEIDEIPSPFTLGLFDLSFRSIVNLETARGCPMKCHYCNWGSRPVRRFSLERITAELNACLDKGVRVVSFQDSSLPESPLFAPLCGVLKELAKERGLRITINVNAERLTAAKADLLKGCGVINAGVGLQSTNEAALRAVGRGFQWRKFIDGVRLLEERNIPFDISTLLGLPKDSLIDILEMKNLLAKERLAEASYCHILSVLPGSRLWSEAASHGLTHDKRPPYFVTGTGSLQPWEMNEAFRIVNSEAPNSMFPRSFVERFGGAEHPAGRSYAEACRLAGKEPVLLDRLVLKLDARKQTAEGWRKAARELSAHLKQVLTIWLKPRTLAEDAGLFKAFLEEALAVNPHLVWSLIIEPGTGDAWQEAASYLKQWAGTGSVHGWGRESRACIVVDRRPDGPQEQMLKEAGSKIPWYRSLRIGKDAGWKRILTDGVRDERCAGVVIDVDPALKKDDNVSVYRAAKKLAGPRSGKLHFRNMALAYPRIVSVLSGKFPVEDLPSRIDPLEVMEAVAAVNADISISPVILPDGEQAAALASFQARPKKTAAAGRRLQ